MTTRMNVRPFAFSRPKARRGIAAISFVLLVARAVVVPAARADQPFAPSRDYDLQNVRVELRFNLDQQQIVGQVTHTLTTLKDGLRTLDFDSVGLTILSARLDGKDARFSTDDAKLHVDLDRAAKAGEKHEVTIRYQGSPKKGVYFVLPNKSYSSQPKEIWTQGEAEDTRYYIPIYDYPNDRTTTEMIVTVPAQLGDGLQRQARERGRRRPGPEDLDVAAIPAHLHVSDFAGGRRVRRTQDHLAQHSRRLSRASRRRRPHRAHLRPHSRHAELFSPTAWACLTPGISTTRRPSTNSRSAEWKTSAPPRSRRAACCIRPWRAKAWKAPTA